MVNRRKPETAPNAEDSSRFLPLLVAGVFCFFVAALLGYGSWRLFGTTARLNGDTSRFFEKFGIVSSGTGTPVAEKTNERPDLPANATKPESQAETSIEIKGAVPVEGGETAVGGGISKRPLRREFVKDFLIDETEVTNGQYLMFVRSTGYRVPEDWSEGTYPEGKSDYPVAFVSVRDATKYCEWRGKSLGMEARLPSYAEWQRAAGGDKRFRYPWGNEWNEAAVISEKKKEASPVKSYELNRSPYGAFDMVGNVWEWTSEVLKKNELVSKTSLSGYRPESRIHLVLGGSFNEDRSKLANSFWAEIDSGTRNKSVGFRCVIVPESK